MINPKVSVIIPTYNSSYLAEAIDSVLSQTFKDLEIIVIDDGSADSTRKVVAQYGDVIRYYFQDNRGVSAARNTGIEKARGEYLAFLDDDDIWLPEKLAMQVAAMDQYPDVGLVWADVEGFDAEGVLRASYRLTKLDGVNNERTSYKIAMMPFNDGSCLKDNLFHEFLHGNLIVSCTVILLRKTHLLDVGFFDEAFPVNQDYDLYLRLSRKHQFLYLNMVLAKYRVREGSISGSMEMRVIRYSEHDAIMLENYYKAAMLGEKELILTRIIDCYRSAIWGNLYFNDQKKMRELAIRSLRLNKHQIKLYFYILISFLPTCALNLLKRCKALFNKKLV